MLATLVFHVIHAASALTSSRVTPGWYLIPPLKGPLASLYWTLYPVNTLMLPSSILTGREAISCLLGWARI